MGLFIDSHLYSKMRLQSLQTTSLVNCASKSSNLLADLTVTHILQDRFRILCFLSGSHLQDSFVEELVQLANMTTKLPQTDPSTLRTKRGVTRNLSKHPVFRGDPLSSQLKAFKSKLDEPNPLNACRWARCIEDRETEHTHVYPYNPYNRFFTPAPTGKGCVWRHCFIQDPHQHTHLTTQQRAVLYHKDWVDECIFRRDLRVSEEAKKPRGQKAGELAAARYQSNKRAKWSYYDEPKSVELMLREHKDAWEKDREAKQAAFNVPPPSPARNRLSSLESLEKAVEDAHNYPSSGTLRAVLLIDDAATTVTVFTEEKPTACSPADLRLRGGDGDEVSVEGAIEEPRSPVRLRLRGGGGPTPASSSCSSSSHASTTATTSSTKALAK